MSGATIPSPIRFDKMTLEDMMATVEKPSAIPAEDMAELQRAVDNAVNGTRDPEAMARAALEMDQGREEIRRRLGEVNLAVELIREARDEE
jgi:transcription initiation factor TFIIIB Brf1 subunit/transcription initiation factor TFIIB